MTVLKGLVKDGTIGGLNVYVLALLFVTLVWGATFPVLKLATAHLSGVETTALRFCIAALCMLPFALRLPRHTWLDGAVLGALVLVSYVLQAYGLEFISSNRSAFLTSLNVLMVPFLAVAFGTRLTWSVLVAAGLACFGIGLMSWEGGAHFVADAATVLSALAYALYVIMLSSRSARHKARELAAAQIVWMAMLGCAWMFAGAIGTDRLQTLPERMNWEVFAGLCYLGIVATSGMLFLQALAQRHVPASKAALVYAMEPVFAAMFAWFMLAEGLGWRAALGGILVVTAVVFSEMRSNAAAGGP
ncbi:MAG: DMT family transporter [Rhodoferax sp.]|nr:MAG: DMT family transporter [Rhodoferax sp.]